MKDTWKVWGDIPEYGENFYERAIGEKDEMESSKSVAKIVQRYLSEDDIICDVGCGGGHYLRSLNNTVSNSFNYIGIDSTEEYIKVANKALLESNFLKCNNAEFKVSDIYNLKQESNSVDITMCNNLLLHLPSIEGAIKELLRITKRTVIIRTLIGQSSFRIKQIREPEVYDSYGEPLNFHYFNIYSKKYLQNILQNYNIEFEIFSDQDYIPENIGAKNYKNSEKPFDITTIIGGLQVNSYIISPWSYLVINKLN